jgi:hypothetical protein
MHAVNVRKCSVCDVIFVEIFSGSGGVRYEVIDGACYPSAADRGRCGFVAEMIRRGVHPDFTSYLCRISFS